MKKTFVSRKDVIAALSTRFKEINPHIDMQNDYVSSNEDNLVEDISFAEIEKDLREGSGKELDYKFKAIHSSCALAVNTFGYWKNKQEELSFYETKNIQSLVFEKKCPTGLNGLPPNLDVVLENKNSVFAIESKFIEIFEKETNGFKDSYNQNNLPYSEPFIFDMIKKYKKTSFPFAQLIKHYLGLLNTYKSKSIILCLAYWLPKNYNDSQIYNELYKSFFEGLEDFQSSFISQRIKFIALNYFDIWNELEKSNKKHIELIRRRYSIEI